MLTRNAILSVVMISVLSSSSQGFEYLFGTKWDNGTSPYTASEHGFSAPNGPQTPGRATWSIMPGGLELDSSASLLDPDHDPDDGPEFATEDILELDIPGFALADYEIMINQAIDTWASVSKFTNDGQVDDGEGDAGAGGAMGDTGVLRFGAWRLTNGALAHAFAPGTESSEGGNNIFGDVHIDPTRNWVDNPTDRARGNDPFDEAIPNGAATFDLFTVLLHEIGHALGLDHSDVEGSVMEPFYEGGRRVLNADDIAGIQALYGGPGAAHFSVAAGAEGIGPPGKAPNAVYTTGPAGGGFLPTTAVIFFSPMDATNTVATDPTGLGLTPADNVDGLSNATSGSHGAGGPVLLFSVDTAAEGVPGTDLHYHAMVSPPAAPHMGATPANPGGGDPGNESASDIYASTELGIAHFGYYPGPLSPVVANSGRNRLYADESVLGLQAPALNGAALGGPEDNMDGMELDGGSPSYFSLSMGSPTAASPALTVYDGGGVPVAYPMIIHMPGETRTPEDVFLGASAAIYAPGHSLGLVPGDDLDALVISDVTVTQFPVPGTIVFSPNSLLNPGIDQALFSLAPGSPSLMLGGFSPGDVFRTSFGGSFSLYASAESLGLLETDNIDAPRYRPRRATAARRRIGAGAGNAVARTAGHSAVRRHRRTLPATLSCPV